MKAIISLSNGKTQYQRQAYTFMSFLGDFGGFNDAMFLIIGSFVSFYSAKMYSLKVASELPTSDRPKPRKHLSDKDKQKAINLHRLRSKIKQSSRQEPTLLDQSDLG